MSLNSRKVFVLGLDGASWYLLDQLMSQGYMPNMKHVREQGASGLLQSTQPPFTGPAWVSCLTGVNPGKHGVFGFTSRADGTRHRTLVSSQSIKAPRIFHYLAKAGKSSGLINVPVTYPADRLNGFMVPCFLTPHGKEDFCFPSGLHAELLQEIGTYIINVRIAERRIDSEELLVKFVEDLLFCTQKRFEAMQVLWSKHNPDFFMIVYNCMDKIQHKFWKFMDPESPLFNTSLAEKVKPHLFRIYQYMDMVLGYILRAMDPETTLFIVSDHGFGTFEKRVFLNKWLAQQDLLRFKKGKAYLNELLYRTGLRKPDFSTSNLAVSDHPVDNYVDYSKTRFFCSDVYEQGIYSNYSHDSTGSEKAYVERECSSLRERLLALKDPDSGVAFVDEVKFREEIYWGPNVGDAPDLLLKMQNYSYLLNKSIPLRGHRFLQAVESPEGCHRPEGIFAAYGKGIQKQKEISASIMDITPSVLHNFSLLVPEEMDGRVLKEIFTSDIDRTGEAQSGAEELVWRPEGLGGGHYNQNEEEEVKARLQDLGYFD